MTRRRLTETNSFGSVAKRRSVSKPNWTFLAILSPWFQVFVQSLAHYTALQSDWFLKSSVQYELRVQLKRVSWRARQLLT